MIKKIIFCIPFLILSSCEQKEKPVNQNMDSSNKALSKNTQLSVKEANNLIELSLSCVEVEYPNKLGQTIGSDADLLSPQQLHPIFYGCFDWHSAVHGYWSMVTLLNQFPDLDKAEDVINILKKNITSEKVKQELAYFEKEINHSYERTYGWAWLLKLAEALRLWDDPLGAELEENLRPLTDLLVSRYIEFLPKLVYPIRVGEHTNTAFGLSFAYDYAKTFGNKELEDAIIGRARDFYLNDQNCPVSWEPSGYDFLSPCLEEVGLMHRILPKEEFLSWLDKFLPELKNKDYSLEVGKVSDRTDGKLVHLDGLNFSRAWTLYALAKDFREYEHLLNIANEHMAYSLPNLVGDSYEGGHWLGSFAIYAMQVNEKNSQ